MASIRFLQGAPYFIDNTGTARQLSFWTVTTASYNPPNLTPGTQTTQTVAVADAAMGDPVVASFSLDLQEMQLTGYVSAPGVVTAVLRNGTLGAVNLAPGGLTIMVATFV